ncbi:MAG: endonuclease MutS2, partial [Acidobacteriota bacterium]
MDRQSRQLLGLARVLELVQEFAHSLSGRELLAALEPSTDRSWLEERLEQVGESGRFLDGPGRIRFSDLEDPRPILRKLRQAGSILAPEQFQTLLEVLRTGRQMVRAFRGGGWPRLEALVASAGTCEEEIALIERTFDRNGEIRDSAHPQLGQVRRRQSRLRRQVQDRLKSYYSGQRAESLIQEPFVTSRNGRFVIPVRSERQKDIEGVVHGASSSGATVFMEPMPVVALNNQLISARDQELEIIRQVLDRLSQALRGNLESLDDLALQMGQADALFAVSEFARRYRCVPPEFDEGRCLVLEQARHPLLLASLAERTVPISVSLSKDQNGMVISGPNTGGKTVALKTVGLLALMAQAGLPVPATRARFPIFRQVLADIGDHQSITAHLSTFSAHIL